MSECFRPYLRHSLQLSDELAALAEESERRPLTDAERQRLARAVRLCKASVREQREAWEDETWEDRQDVP